MWSSFESVCNIGEKIDPNKYFTVNSALNAYKAQIFDTNLFINQQQHQHQQQLNQQIQQHQQQQYQSNNHQQQPLQSNVLKQIDQQNDMLDSKNKQDIAHILRMVEADQQNKLNTIKQQQNRVSLSSHHPNCCFHSKENSLGNDSTSEQQAQQPQSSTSGQEQELQICSCQSFTNESIHETSNNDPSNNSFQKLSKQTPLLNQV
jgi:hypothetical protein